MRSLPLALAACVALTAACGGSGSEKTFADPGRIVVAAGRYRGVGVGAPEERVFAVFGGEPASEGEPVIPADATVDDYLGPATAALGEAGPSAVTAIYRFDGVVFYVVNHVVSTVGLSAGDARTERGLGSATRSTRPKGPSPSSSAET